MSMIAVDEKLYFNLWTHKQAYSIFFFSTLLLTLIWVGFWGVRFVVVGYSYSPPPLI